MEIFPKPPAFMKISTIHTDIIQRVRRFGMYLNEIFRKSDPPFVLEFYEDGFVIFTERPENFQKIYLLRSEMTKSTKTASLPIKDNIFLHGLNLDEKFPTTGMVFEVSLSFPFAEQIIEVLKANYAQIHPRIHFQNIDASKFNIVFETPEAMMSYAAYIQSYAGKLDPSLGQ
ncbi:MAG: hypothetical protein ACTSVZ_09445 [Promethearchaeota archaeon]